MLLLDIYIYASIPASIGAFMLWFDTSVALNYLFLPLLYAASVLGFSVLHVILSCIGSIFVNKKRPVVKPTWLALYLIHSTCDLLARYMGVRVSAFDLKLLPKGPYYLVCNHRSNFDPLVTAPYLKSEKLCYISKNENFKIPVGGEFMVRAGYIGIDRQNPHKAMEAIIAATNRLKAGVNVAVYPEGTRSKSDQLSEFHSGVFLPARKAGVPIVVIAIKNTEKIAKNIFRRFTHVELKFCGVLDAQKVSTTGTHELASITRGMIDSALS